MDDSFKNSSWLLVTGSGYTCQPVRGCKMSRPSGVYSSVQPQFPSPQGNLQPRSFDLYVTAMDCPVGCSESVCPDASDQCAELMHVLTMLISVDFQRYCWNSLLLLQVLKVTAAAHSSLAEPANLAASLVPLSGDISSASCLSTSERQWDVCVVKDSLFVTMHACKKDHGRVMQYSLADGRILRIIRSPQLQEPNMMAVQN